MTREEQSKAAMLLEIDELKSKIAELEASGKATRDKYAQAIKRIAILEEQAVEVN